MKRPAPHFHRVSISIQSFSNKSKNGYFHAQTIDNPGIIVTKMITELYTVCKFCLFDGAYASLETKKEQPANHLAASLKLLIGWRMLTTCLSP